MEKSNSTSDILFQVLRILVVILGILFIIYPYIPQNIFIAKLPVDGSTFHFFRSHGLTVPFHLAWAFEGSKKIPLLLKIGGLFLFFGLPFFKKITISIPRLFAQTQISPYILYPAVFIISSTVFYLFKVTPQLNAAFGDGPTLPGEIDQGIVFGAEVLTGHFFLFSRKILDLFIVPPNGLLAAQISSALSGGIFVTSILLLARSVGKNWKEKSAVFFGVIFTGYLVMFFGYVETTNLELASMAMFFAFVSKFIFSETKKNLWLILSLTSLSIVFMAHAAGLLLGITVPVLLFDYRENIKQTLFSGRNYRNLLFFLVFIAIPYYLIICRPFYLQGNYGNIRGGGDLIMFVPWVMDYIKPASPFTYYSMISWWHFTDILSVFLIAATFSTPLVFSSLILKIKNKIKFGRRESNLVLILGLSAAATATIPLFWNHDFGMWGDWNLSATYLFPLNIFAWVIFIFTLRKQRSKKKSKMIVQILLIQMLFLLGMYMQFK